MGTYKVIQDIEAEDKFLGPLTLKQFIYGAVAVVCAYLSFLLITKGAGLLAIIFLPFIAVSGFFAWPFARDQPTEIWALAKVRFMLKPHRRIWDQSGIKELVTITAPKKIERILTKNFSQTEVKSRLEALASTIDSRGWAVKNMSSSPFDQPAYAAQESDRLVGPSASPPTGSDPDSLLMEDILDEKTSPTAQHFDQMIASSTQVHKKQVVAKMKQAAGPQPDYWFMRGEPTAPASVPAGYSTFQSQVVPPGVSDYSSPQNTAQPSANDLAVLQKIHSDQSKPNPAYGHTHTLKPLSAQSSNATMPSAPDPAILQLAGNDDLNVATIARQADKAARQADDGEVVISLR